MDRNVPGGSTSPGDEKSSGRLLHGRWARFKAAFVEMMDRRAFLDSDGKALIDSSYQLEEAWVLRGFLILGLFFGTFPALWGLEVDRVVGHVSDADGWIQASASSLERFGIAMSTIMDVLSFDIDGNVVIRFLDLFVFNRVFPLLGLILGTGLAFVWMQIRRAAKFPEQMLYRGILMLITLGIPLAVAVPDNVMIGFAISGLFFVIPLLLLPMKWQRRAITIIGAPLAVTAALFGSVELSMAGFLMVGFGLALLRIPWFVRTRPWIPAMGLLVLIPMTLAALYWQIMSNYELGLQPTVTSDVLSANTVAGVVMCTTYLFIVMVAMSTPLKKMLMVTVGVLGKAPLTNYLAALIAVNVFRVPLGTSGYAIIDHLGISGSSTQAWGRAMVFIALIALADWTITALWFRFTRFQFGPAEMLMQAIHWFRMERLPEASQLSSAAIRRGALEHLLDIDAVRGQYSIAELRPPARSKAEAAAADEEAIRLGLYGEEGIMNGGGTDGTAPESPDPGSPVVK
ncbi:hypothetical protein [Corynebacterium sp. H113]|uniref:hypothetical protein n=1 Tax=Corynebacterium sp. H113 TaxID=3133419 RepID=UPI0030A444A4